MKTPSISDAEWEVMNVIWHTAPISANDVADALCDRMQWSPKTVKTLLGRLVTKRVLRFTVEGNRYMYSPAIARERFVRNESQSFLQRVFEGETTPLLMHFVENVELSQEEIEELQKLLDRKKE